MSRVAKATQQNESDAGTNAAWPNPGPRELTEAFLAGTLEELIAGRTLGGDVPEPTFEQWEDAGLTESDWITTGETIRGQWRAQQRVDIRARKATAERAKEDALIASHHRGRAASIGTNTRTDDTSEF